MERRHSSEDTMMTKALAHRLDPWFRELNAFLIVLAVGLAILDVTCFTALKLRDMPIAQGDEAAPALSQTQVISALVR